MNGGVDCSANYRANASANSSTSCGANCGVNFSADSNANCSADSSTNASISLALILPPTQDARGTCCAFRCALPGFRGRGAQCQKFHHSKTRLQLCDAFAKSWVWTLHDCGGVRGLSHDRQHSWIVVSGHRVTHLMGRDVSRGLCSCSR